MTISNTATPTHQHHDVIALQERIVELQQKLSERAMPPTSHDIEQELADKSVSACLPPSLIVCNCDTIAV